MSSRAVGILGYQGCIEPHEALFHKLGVTSVRVRTEDDLTRVDRLILPGGESTTMLKFLHLHGMINPLREFAKKNAVWGMCAGAILAAHEVTNPSQDSLNIIDIAAHRNFYGSQLDSFSTTLPIDLLQKPIEAHFIRAPLLVKTPTHDPSRGPVTIESYHNDQPVFFSQGRIWACSFHVELGSDTSLHEKFLSL